MKLDELEVYIPKRSAPNFQDLAGTETEFFTIISRAPNSKSGTTRWNCICKACGEYCVKEKTNLMRHRSCGCERAKNIGKALRKDIANKKFGKLTAIQDTGKSNASGNAIWICRCECGNTCNVDSNNLISLHTYSCGCIKYSIGVKNIIMLLQENSIEYQLEVPAYDIEGINNSQPCRFDFAIIDQNTIIRLIEFDGEQHYKQMNGYMANEPLQKRQERDMKKNQWAFEHNIPLVRIPYWERNNITLEMILGDQYLVKPEQF